jgi:hypothetical protein
MSIKLVGWLFAMILFAALLGTARANEITIVTLSLGTIRDATTIEIRLPEEGRMLNA